MPVRRFSRGIRRKAAIPSGLRALVQNSLASSGSITYAGSGQSENVTWLTGAQGFNTSDIEIMSQADISGSFITAIANTTGATDTSAPIIEPRFWIASATLRLQVTNHHQIDCWVTVWPYVARYHNTGRSSATTLNNNATLDTQAFAAGTVVGTSAVVGYNPFHNRGLTTVFRLMKPRRVFLQGGQSYRFKLKMDRPWQLTYGNYQAGANETIPNRTMGFLVTCQGITVREDLDPLEVAPGAGAVALQWENQYHWVCGPMPHHYSDIISDYPVIATPAIIQPQTGAVNNAPVAD